MSNIAPQPQGLADDDPSVVLAESRLRMLRRLAEIGMELAERALNTQVAPAKGKDPADVFAPLSRAIRLTLALEAKTDEELRDLRAGVVRKRKKEAKRAAKRHEAATAKDAQERAERVCELVADAAEAEIPDVYEFAGLYHALRERLEDDPAYRDCGQRPLRETVERLCKDLMLSPTGAAGTARVGSNKRVRPNGSATRYSTSRAPCRSWTTTTIRTSLRQSPDPTTCRTATNWNEPRAFSDVALAGEHIHTSPRRPFRDTSPGGACRCTHLEGRSRHLSRRGQQIHTSWRPSSKHLSQRARGG